MTFLNKSHGEWDKVNKPVTALISSCGSEDENIEIVSENNNFDDNFNVVSDIHSNDKEEEEEERNILG